MITFVISQNLIMLLEQLNSLYSLLKSSHISGRYVTNSDIEKCLVDYPKSITSVIGYSEEGRSIYSIKIGRGAKRVLLWSQMHGNESTTTKAVIDCINLFLTNNILPNSILTECTLLIIPILNPDGAERYTRLNANNIDLNRDAKDLSQSESRVLRKVYDDFKPDFCFNLHGQRTIYNVGDTNKSSILSFLSPSQDAERTITSNRKVAMQVISEINTFLQAEIPGCIARYDDAFNINCVGDMFQFLDTPTLLYEAGHYPSDYSREEVRRLMFLAILKALLVISDEIDTTSYEDYFKIPENDKKFYDIIIRNAKLEQNSDTTLDIGILYREELKNKKIEFIPVVESISKLDGFFGHREIDVNGQLVTRKENLGLEVSNEIDFVLKNYEKISLKS